MHYISELFSVSSAILSISDLKFVNHTMDCFDILPWGGSRTLGRKLKHLYIHQTVWLNSLPLPTPDRHILRSLHFDER